MWKIYKKMGINSYFMKEEKQIIRLLDDESGQYIGSVL